MANKSYKCPICGKIWYTEKDVANCVVKDAAEAEKTKSEACRIEACRKSDYNDLMKSKRLVEDKYEELHKLVYTYNVKAQTCATKYKQSLSRCDITCAFRTVGSFPWLYSNEAEKAKEFGEGTTATYPSFENDLRDIIRKELDF